MAPAVRLARGDAVGLATGCLRPSPKATLLARQQLLKPRGEVARLSQDLVGHPLTPLGQLLRQAGIGQGQDASGQMASVSRAHGPHAHGGHWDSRGHLYRGEQGVEAGEGRVGKRDADHRQRGVLTPARWAAAPATIWRP